MFTSCKSNTKSSFAKDTIGKSASLSSPNQLIAKFKPIIQGVWLKKDYFDKVIRTRSPLAAEGLAFGLTDMYIEIDSIKKDSLVVVTGWANQDGSDLVLKFKPGKTPNTITFTNYDLGYKITSSDTILILYNHNNEKDLNPIIEYKKIGNKESSYDEGVDIFINKNLISGNYLIETPSASPKKVVFTDNGDVTGLSKYKTFSVLNDLIGQQEEDIDEIEFDISSRNPQYYAFKIDGDTLNLYNIRHSADAYKLMLGSIAYKLVKQK